MLSSEIIYYSQLDGYVIKSVLTRLYQKVKDNLLNVFMCFVIMLSMYIINFDNIYFLCVYIIGSVVVWIWAGNQFEFLKKIKYTKRVLRQIVLMTILHVICFVLLVFIKDFYLAIGFPILFFIVYLIYSLTLLLLLPIEHIIGSHFVNLAKKNLRKHDKLIKIGITGSFGKTSTKEILGSILREEFSTLITPKSYNTPLGIAKTINENLKNTHEVFVCEMGAKNRGEITELCRFVDIDLGVVTAVGRQHLSTFGSIENVYKTKKELPDYLYQKPCVFNLMNKYVLNMYKDFIYQKIGVFVLPKRKLKIFKVYIKKRINRLSLKNSKTGVFCEYAKRNNVYAKNLISTSEKTTFDLFENLQFVCRVETKLLGIHNVINILLASASAMVLGVSALSIVKGIRGIKSINARLEKNKNDKGAVIINNGYNSNLDSAPYSLSSLKLFDVKNKVVVTPGIIECDDDYKCNFEFGKIIANYCTEVIIVKRKNRKAIIDGLVSKNFAKNKIHVLDNFEEVKPILNDATSDYVFLIENDLPDNYK